MNDIKRINYSSKYFEDENRVFDPARETRVYEYDILILSSFDARSQIQTALSHDRSNFHGR